MACPAHARLGRAGVLAGGGPWPGRVAIAVPVLHRHGLAPAWHGLSGGLRERRLTGRAADSEAQEPTSAGRQAKGSKVEDASVESSSAPGASGRNAADAALPGGPSTAAAAASGPSTSAAGDDAAAAAASAERLSQELIAHPGLAPALAVGRALWEVFRLLVLLPLKLLLLSPLAWVLSKLGLLAIRPADVISRLEAANTQVRRAAEGAA